MCIRDSVDASTLICDADTLSACVRFPPGSSEYKYDRSLSQDNGKSPNGILPSISLPQVKRYIYVPGVKRNVPYASGGITRTTV